MHQTLLVHGWADDSCSNLEVQWMTNPPAPKEVLQAVSCSCQATNCKTNKCSCQSFKLPCTDLCNCLHCKNSTSIVQPQYDKLECDD